MTSEYKNTTQQHESKKYGELVNKLFSWALVRQVATCRFHACVYRRRSFYRIFNALAWRFSCMVCAVESSSDDSVLVTSSGWDSWHAGRRNGLVARFHRNVERCWRGPHCTHSTPRRLCLGMYTASQKKTCHSTLWTKEKHTKMSFCYIFYKTRPILIKFGAYLLSEFVTQKCKRISLHLNNVSTLPGETFTYKTRMLDKPVLLC